MAVDKRKVRSILIKSGFYKPVMFLRRHLLRRHELDHLRETVSFFKQFIQPGDLVFDVGGNIGNAAEAFLQCGAQVITLEPLPHCSAELRARFAGQARFECVQKAVGAKPGFATLYIHRNDFMSSFNKQWSEHWQGSVEVPVTTVDELIAEFGLPKFLKIDVEGWETEVLAGFSNVVPMLSFEFHSGQNGYQSVADCIDRLMTLGEVQLNRTPAEHWQLAHSQWLGREAFLADLSSHMKAHPDSYGDILVRMNRRS